MINILDALLEMPVGVIIEMTFDHRNIMGCYERVYPSAQMLSRSIPLLRKSIDELLLNHKWMVSW